MEHELINIPLLLFAIFGPPAISIGLGEYFRLLLRGSEHDLEMALKADQVVTGVFLVCLLAVLCGAIVASFTHLLIHLATGVLVSLAGGGPFVAVILGLFAEFARIAENLQHPLVYLGPSFLAALAFRKNFFNLYFLNLLMGWIPIVWLVCLFWVFMNSSVRIPMHLADEIERKRNRKSDSKGASIPEVRPTGVIEFSSFCPVCDSSSCSCRRGKLTNIGQHESLTQALLPQNQLNGRDVYFSRSKVNNVKTMMASREHDLG